MTRTSIQSSLVHTVSWLRVLLAAFSAALIEPAQLILCAGYMSPALEFGSRDPSRPPPPPLSLLPGDGTTKEIDVKNKTHQDISLVMDRLRSTATGRARRLQRPIITRNPSIQGPWDPSLNFQQASTALRESAVGVPPASALM